MNDELGRISIGPIETSMIEVELEVYREHPDAKMPEVAYEGTSACFDLYAVERTSIPPAGSAMVPVGVRLTIPKGYYVEFATRSGHGIGKGLRVHPGIIDHGYAGEWSVRMFNLTGAEQIIEKGKAAVQCKVHRIPAIGFKEITEEEFDKYRQESIRGDNGFGSSDKK